MKVPRSEAARGFVEHPSGSDAELQQVPSFQRFVMQFCALERAAGHQTVTQCNGRHLSDITKVL